MIDEKENKTSSSSPFNSDCLFHQFLKKNSICFRKSVAVRRVVSYRQEQQLWFKSVDFRFSSIWNGLIRESNVYRTVDP